MPVFMAIAQFSGVLEWKKQWESGTKQVKTALRTVAPNRHGTNGHGTNTHVTKTLCARLLAATAQMSTAQKPTANEQRR